MYFTMAAAPYFNTVVAALAAVDRSPAGRRGLVSYKTIPLIHRTKRRVAQAGRRRNLPPLAACGARGGQHPAPRSLSLSPCRAGPRRGAYFRV